MVSPDGIIINFHYVGYSFFGFWCVKIIRIVSVVVDDDILDGARQRKPISHL